MTFGEPIHVARETTDEERARLREQLQGALLAGTRGSQSAIPAV